MTDVFLDEVSVNLGELKVLIDNAGRQVAISQSEARTLENAPSNVTATALTEGKSFLVIRSDSLGVGDDGCLDPVTQFMNERPQIVELFFRRNERGTARNNGHNMGHLAAQQSADLRCLGLHGESLNVMSGSDKVEFSRKLELGIGLTVLPPVAREDG